MPTVRVAPTSPLLQRTCLSCGYRGNELQRSGERTSYRCPGCGQDLYARPPRSYAEMEGIPVQIVTARPAPEPAPVSRRARSTKRSLLDRTVTILVSIIGRLTRRLGIAPRPAKAAPQVRRPRGATRR